MKILSIGKSLTYIKINFMTKRSSLVGFTNLKNKVHKNAFDLSHRHMYSAEIGELLPVFYQWCNPNETFKIGYQGMTRTLPLQTAAFTRLRENIQYYFVPFQSLWKYFEQSVNNMTVGQSGEPISKIAQSAVDAATISTRMPYISYNYFNKWFSSHLKNLADRLVQDVAHDFSNSGLMSGIPTLEYLMAKVRTYRRSDNSFIFLSSFDTFRYVGSAKLLNALGYGNFYKVYTYDLMSSLIQWFTKLVADGKHLYDLTTTDVGNPIAPAGELNTFFTSEFGIQFTDFESSPDVTISNCPSLSILPLLAYQKIVQDHYRYRQWQPYIAQLCNIDYITPNSDYEFNRHYSNEISPTIFDMQFGNLPLDYFNGVLPKAQYGDESAALIDVDTSSIAHSLELSNPSYLVNASHAELLGPPSTGQQSLTVDNSTIFAGNTPVQVRTDHHHNFSAAVDDIGSGSLRISALRSALALQKYKEIQNANDSDFASQVLAHFGIKPKHDDYKSTFIGGGDATIDINPQVNQTLDTPESKADIKAIATSTLSAGCKFTADTYGIIIGIYRCTPQLDFAHVGIDRNLYKTDASDFPIPELDSIGMQTQYRSEVAALPIGLSHRLVMAKDNGYDFAETYGYLPRYAELKTSYDRFEGAFLDSQSSWVTGYTPNMISSWLGTWSGLNSSTDKRLNVSDLLKVRPSLCYPIFFDQFSGSVNDDKLLIGSVNTCVAVRPFSKYGLPYES